MYIKHLFFIAIVKNNMNIKCIVLTIIFCIKISVIEK